MPPVVPPYRQQAKRRMQWGLDPRISHYSTGRQSGGGTPSSPQRSMKENTGQEVGRSIPAAAPGHATPANERRLASAGLADQLTPIPGQPGGPVIPLGAGTNTMPAGGAYGRGIGIGSNPRSGQDYQAYEMGNREFHNYGGGNVVSFERKPSPQLEARKQQAQAALLAQLAAMQSHAAAAHAQATIAPPGGPGAAGIIGSLMGPGLGMQAKRRNLGRGY